MKIPLINDHLLYEYIVRWSVSQAKKGLNVQKIEKYISGRIFKIEV